LGKLLCDELFIFFWFRNLLTARFRFGFGFGFGLFWVSLGIVTAFWVSEVFGFGFGFAFGFALGFGFGLIWITRVFSQIDKLTSRQPVPNRFIFLTSGDLLSLL
jgi:hypothetical protein